MKWFKLIFICVFLLVSNGCSTPQHKHLATQPVQQGNVVERLAKSDIDEVIELHQRIVLGHLKQLMIKLYKRNPHLRHDKTQRDIKQSVNLVFKSPDTIDFPQWQGKKSTDLIHFALNEKFVGQDRVLPLVLGLYQMLMASHDNHTQFYYLTSISEQKLYNSARNVEIAAWLLANKKNGLGELLLLSDSVGNQRRNLSFQRLFGEMVATQDNIAAIVSQKTGRAIKSIMQRAASMVFLPI
jgi:hypothetical protein